MSSGEAGNDYVAATGNANLLDGGPGNDQTVAAAGHSANRYFFLPGSGQNSITGFEGGADDDVIDLRGFGLANFAALDHNARHQVASARTKATTCDNWTTRKWVAAS